MYTRESLLDIHERSHRSLTRLLEYCRQFSTDEINREMPVFGQNTIRLLFYHTIGAEKYWTGVLLGQLYTEDAAANDKRFATAILAAIPLGGC